MKLRGGSFGLVVLAIVMAVVLILVAQVWKRVAPAALDVAGENQGQPGAAQAVQQVRQSTDAHSEEVGQALAATE